MMTRDKYSDYCLQASGWSFIASALFLPFSTALLNVTCILGTVLWLISGKAWEHTKLFIRNPIWMSLIALLILLFASLMWTSAPDSVAIEYLKKYRKLLYFFALFSICSIYPIWRERYLQALFIACFGLACASVCVALGVPGFPKPDVYQGAIVVKSHITQGVFMGVLVVLSAYLVFFQNNLKKKYLGVVGIALGVFVTFYLANGRTGYLSVAVALGAVAFFIPKNFKTTMAMIAVGVIALGAIWMTSDRLHSRMEQGVNEVALAYQNDARSNGTSMGLRMKFWDLALSNITRSPIVGTGVGSYEVECEKTLVMKSRSQSLKRRAPTNPHQDFLSFGVQVGLLGLCCWLAFLISQFIKVGATSRDQSFLLRSMILLYLSGALFNSFMLDVSEGSLFICLFAVLATVTIRLPKSNENL